MISLLYWIRSEKKGGQRQQAAFKCTSRLSCDQTFTSTLPSICHFCDQTFTSTLQSICHFCSQTYTNYNSVYFCHLCDHTFTSTLLSICHFCDHTFTNTILSICHFCGWSFTKYTFSTEANIKKSISIETGQCIIDHNDSLSSRQINDIDGSGCMNTYNRSGCDKWTQQICELKFIKFQICTSYSFYANFMQCYGIWAEDILVQPDSLLTLCW